jgi:hypothetical protein
MKPTENLTETRVALLLQVAGEVAAAAWAAVAAAVADALAVSRFPALLNLVTPLKPIETPIEPQRNPYLIQT